MKANKALKRLAKIESLMSVVTERYSESVPHLRRVLQDATDAVARAKHAVSLQASSGAKAAKAHRAEKTTAPSQKKASVKKVAANARRAEATKKSTPVKKTAKKRAARKTAVVPAEQTATEAVAK